VQVSPAPQSEAVTQPTHRQATGSSSGVAPLQSAAVRSQLLHDPESGAQTCSPTSVVSLQV
jgi:hypothetical protein